MKKAVLAVLVTALASVPAFPQGDAVETGAVVVGMFGNVLGGIAGGILGARIGGDERDSLRSAVFGALAGSVIGSALTVHGVAGRHGSLGMALLGAMAGELAAVAAVAVLGDGGDIGLAALVPFVVLPPLGAAIGEGRSASGRAFRGDGGIFNLTGCRLELGVPGIAVRPVLAPGLKAGSRWRCDVRLLRVEL